jgi:hypothetical protein
VGKLEGKWPLGRPRRRWEDNIRMDLLELGWGDVDWIGLTQDRNSWRALQSSCIHFDKLQITPVLNSSLNFFFFLTNLFVNIFKISFNFL